MDVLKLASITGAAPNVSDAYTINGQPGDLYRCYSKGLVLSSTIPAYLIMEIVESRENNV